MGAVVEHTTGIVLDNDTRNGRADWLRLRGRGWQAWPQGLHVGGGITADNAAHWLALGAEKVIVTSWLFVNGVFAEDRAAQVAIPAVQRKVELLRSLCSLPVLHMVAVGFGGRPGPDCH